MKKYVLGLVVLVVLFTNFSSADFVDDFSSFGSTIIASLEYIGKTIGSFFSSLGDLIFYIYNGIQTLRYGFITILTSIYNIILDFFNSGFFS